MQTVTATRPHSRKGIPTSEDGTPLFRQGDPRWGRRELGANPSTTIASAGCAMTAMAMAISKVGNVTYTPLQLDTYLDVSGGYEGNAIRWDVAARMVGFYSAKVPWSLDLVRAELAAGRPVVVGVDYKPGSTGGKDGTDHWIVITATKEGGSFSANDPATGQVIHLEARQDGKLVGGPLGYTTTGQLVVLSRGTLPSEPTPQQPRLPRTPGTST